MSNRPRAALILLMTLMLAAACTDTTEPVSNDLDIATEKNRAQWALPLDDYTTMAVSLKSSRVREVAMSHCMAAYNIRYPQSDWPDFAADPTHNNIGRRLFNVEIATEFGYHTGPYDAAERRKERADLDAYLITVSTPTGSAAEAECIAEQEASAPPLPDGVRVGDDLAGRAYNAAIVDQQVLDAVERWRDCMEPLGIENLPEWPEDMPTSELAETWRDGRPSGETAPIFDWTPPPAEEFEVAIADAQCREESGFAEAFYEAEWNAQVALMADNQEKLEQAEASIQKYDQELDQVLAELE